MDQVREIEIREIKEIEINELSRSGKELIQESDSVSRKSEKLDISANSVTKSQLKAIMYKNVSFQKKQVANNLYQLLAPFICIFIIWLSHRQIKKEFSDSYDFDQIKGIPFFTNLPFSFFSQSAAYPIASSDCDKWILYRDDRTEAETQAKGNFTTTELFHSPFFEMCEKVNKSVPYFVESKNNLNTELFSILDDLNKVDFTSGVEVEGLDKLPDAAINVRSLQTDNISLQIQINDHLYSEFHRDNGFTKQSFKIPRNLGMNITDSTKKMKEKLMNLDESNIKEESEKLINKTSTSFERMFKNRKTTFPVS